MARVAVLGASGFIGTHLADRLETLGHDVRRVDLRGGWRADLRSLSDTVDAIEGRDWVCHLAADMGGVGYFHSDQDWRASVDNGRITLNVAQACALTGTARVLYTSSACAYPVAEMWRRLPEHMLGWGEPDQLYGAEKLHGARVMVRAPFDARVAVLDTVYGPGQQGVGPRAKFPPAVAHKALVARDTGGPVEVWGDGGQRRSFLYVDDCVDRLVTLLEADTAPDVVNVGGQQTVTCLQVAEWCCDWVGIPLSRIVTDTGGPTGVHHREGLDLSRWVDWFGPVVEVGVRDGFGRLIEQMDMGAAA